MKQPRFYKDKSGRTQVTMAESEAEQDQLCDFCSSKDRPFRVFNCNDFLVGHGITSLAAWLACPICTILIEHRDKEALLRRSENTLNDPSIPRWFSLQTLRTIHNKFFQNLISDN
jgi:hypothetical protein